MEAVAWADWCERNEGEFGREQEGGDDGQTEDWVKARPEDRTPARRKAKKDWHARDEADALPAGVDLARLCRMATGEAMDYVDDAVRRLAIQRLERVRARVEKLRADVAARERAVRSGRSDRKRERTRGAIRKLREKLADEEARLADLLEHDEWREFQLSVQQACCEVVRELCRPVERPAGAASEPARSVLVRIGDRQLGPVGIDGWLDGWDVARIVAAVADDAGGIAMPESYHFELNGRPFLGCISRTLQVNGSLSGGGILHDVLSVVLGPEPPRDAMQLAPHVMKAKLMRLLGLERDPGFPGADSDRSPDDREELERERLMALGICPTCSEPLVWMEDSCDKVCERCAVAHQMLDTTFRAAYTEHSSVTKTNYYERRDHFITLLKEFQGKEGKEVPEDVLDDVVIALAERRLVEPEQIDAELVRNVLRATGHSTYYKNVHSIMCTLLGIPPPSLSDQQARSMMSMFMALQGPWNQMTRVEKEGRKNFLNYYYVMRKLAELSGMHEFVHRFRLLKHDPRLAQYDRIWECLMRKRGWPFIPTVAPSRTEVRKAVLANL